MECFKELLKNITDVLKVKNLIPILLTLVLGYMLISDVNPSKEFTTVFSTSYGIIITHFFDEKQ